MTAAAIIKHAAADGVTIMRSSRKWGDLKATGDRKVLRRWIPIIREHKAGIVAALQDAEELQILVAQVYRNDTESDRAEALAAALADPEAALECYRAIVKERQ